MGTSRLLLDTKKNSIIKNYEEHKSNLITAVNEFDTYTSASPYKGFAEYLSHEELKEGSKKAFAEGGGFISFLSYISNVNKANKKLLESIYKDSVMGNTGPVVAGKEATITRPPDSSPPMSPRLNSPENNPNVSKFNDKNTYDRAFSKVEGFPGDQPSFENIEDGAALTFNLGQILGPAFGSPANVAKSYFSSGIDEVLLGIERGRLGFWDFIDYLTTNSQSRALTTAYSSAFNRPPTPIRKKESLDIMLQQNLLLPGDNLSNVDTFKNTYINNNNAGNDPSIPEGVMGGTSIREIQEPDIYGTKAFKFSDDEAYLNSDKHDRGFTNNINVNSDKLNPAVINSNQQALTQDITSGVFNKFHGDFARFLDFLSSEDANAPGAIESIGHAENQYFPFMFETENRGGDGDFKQYCFLQATLNQMQEGFQPNWTPKSFFGRTEKIYTYSETDRTLDIQFVIFANSMRELQNVYERTNWLAQQCYGQFDIDTDFNVNRVKTGPLLRLTIGDIFSRIPGYIRSLTYNWDHGGAGGKWELTKGVRMPVTCQAQLSYQVIHAALPDRNFDFYWGLQAGVTTTKEDGGQLISQPSGDKGTESESYVDFLRRKG